jgi:hypothetical protein
MFLKINLREQAKITTKRTICDWLEVVVLSVDLIQLRSKVRCKKFTVFDVLATLAQYPSKTVP